MDFKSFRSYPQVIHIALRPLNAFSRGIWPQARTCGALLAKVLIQEIVFTAAQLEKLRDFLDV